MSIQYLGITPELQPAGDDPRGGCVRGTVEAWLLSAGGNLENARPGYRVSVLTDAREIAGRYIEAHCFLLSRLQRDALKTDQRANGSICRSPQLLGIEFDDFITRYFAGIHHLHRDLNRLAGVRLLRKC